MPNLQLSRPNRVEDFLTYCQSARNSVLIGQIKHWVGVKLVEIGNRRATIETAWIRWDLVSPNKVLLIYWDFAISGRDLVRFSRFRVNHCPKKSNIVRFFGVYNRLGGSNFGGGNLPIDLSISDSEDGDLPPTTGVVDSGDRQFGSKQVDLVPGWHRHP